MEIETQCPLKIVTQVVIQFCVSRHTQKTNFVTNVPQVKYQGHELTFVVCFCVDAWTRDTYCSLLILQGKLLLQQT